MNKPIRVLTFNVWLKPDSTAPRLLGFASQANEERARAIAAELAPRLTPSDDGDIDVVVFNEAFEYATLMSELKRLAPDINFTTIVKPKKRILPLPTGLPIPLPLLPLPLPPQRHSGILIATRHSIRHQEFYQYRNALYPDIYAAKGVVYAEVAIPNSDPESTVLQNFHVFGTHLQSDETWFGNPQLTRQSQLGELLTFVEKVVPSRLCAEPVIVAGDLNINLGTAEYNDMLTSLSAYHGRVIGNCTFDPKNTWNKDDAKSQYLDYVLVLSNDYFKRAVNRGVHEVQIFRDTIEGEEKDLSDHYGVMGQYEFTEMTHPQPACRVTITLVSLTCEDANERPPDQMFVLTWIRRAGMQEVWHYSKAPGPNAEWHMSPETPPTKPLNHVLVTAEIDAPSAITVTLMESDEGQLKGPDDKIGRVCLHVDPRPDCKHYNDYLWPLEDTYKIGKWHFRCEGKDAVYKMRLTVNVAPVYKNVCDPAGDRKTPPPQYACG